MSERFCELITAISLATLFVFLATAPSFAQGQATWNRKVESLSVIPSVAGGPGTYDITLGWHIHIVTATGTASDVGTEVDLNVNAGLVTTQAVPASDPGAGAGGADPSACPVATCTGGCGSMTINASAAALSCDNSSGSCLCQSPLISNTFPAVPLVAEDVVEVLLRPAPGALPDTQMTDDTAKLVFGSWNRRMLAITADPAPAGPQGTFDITAQWVIEVNHDPTIPVEVGVEVDLSINGQPESTICDPDCIIWDIQDGCEHACATEPDGSSCGTANLSGTVVPLTCDAANDSCDTPPLNVVFPSVALTPGDEITVLLRPAPGALPELPPLDDDTLSITLVPVPTLSEWGVVAMSLLVLIAGILVFRRRWAAYP